MDGGLGPGLIAAIVGIGLVLLLALVCGIIRSIFHTFVAKPHNIPFIYSQLSRRLTARGLSLAW